MAVLCGSSPSASNRLRITHGKIGPMSPSVPALPVLLHTAFYKFTPLPQPEDVAARLRQLVSQIDGLTGSILVASEGINGMLAGTSEAVDRIEAALLHDAAFAD